MGICILEGVMKAKLFIEILDKTLLPFINGVYADGRKKNMPLFLELPYMYAMAVGVGGGGVNAYVQQDNHSSPCSLHVSGNVKASISIPHPFQPNI